MLKVSGSVDVLDFDAAAYTKAVNEKIAAEFRQAARAFIRAALPRVPVDSGMARGSFLNVGRFLRVAVPITPRRTGLKYYPGGGKKPILKTAEAGAKLATRGEDVVKVLRGRVTFTFQTKVFHYLLEDQFGVRSGPWGSFEAGRAAFIESVRTLKDRLPSIKGFITKTTITFGDGRATRSAPTRLDKTERVGE